MERELELAINFPLTDGEKLMAAEIERLRAERRRELTRLAEEARFYRTENVQLRTLLGEAAEDIESWGAYASDYFQRKHDLAGCVAKYDSIATGGALPPSDAELQRLIAEADE